MTRPLFPAVSDHAIVRYLERIEGRDMDALRARIVTPEVRKAVNEFGNGVYPSPAGCRLYVRDGMVVTVLRAKGESS